MRSNVAPISSATEARRWRHTSTLIGSKRLAWPLVLSTVFVFQVAPWSVELLTNIVELIAHRGLDHNGRQGDFRRAELLGVSELGLVGAPSSLAAGLAEYGLELWEGSLEPGRLAFVGEKGRTLILAPPGRGWLPTGRPAEPHPVDVLLKAGGGRIRRFRLP